MTLSPSFEHGFIVPTRVVNCTRFAYPRCAAVNRRIEKPQIVLHTPLYASKDCQLYLEREMLKRSNNDCPKTAASDA